MNSKAYWRRLVIVSILAAGISSTGYANIIHEQRSLYRNILVSEDNNKRCMRFVVRERQSTNQSCIYLDNSRNQVFDYTKLLTAALLVKPQAQDILIVGLGGGTLPRTFHELLPQAQITSVEIDPAVVKAAKQYFAYSENTQVHTVIQDARVYIKRMLREGKRWDLIVLDAFNGDYIPEHLMTQEFLTEVKKSLKPNGMVAANTFANSRLYQHESVTYESVFPHLAMFISTIGNRVLFAAETPIAVPDANAAIDAWQNRLNPYGIDLASLFAMRREPNWNRDAKVLTDQYSPANLLNH